MEEQVVPGLASTTVVPVKRTQVPRLRSKKVVLKTDNVKEHSVPGIRATKRQKVEATFSELSPTAEYKGKMRWATPPRVGKWIERWESARELSRHVAVRSIERNDVSNAVRMIIAEAVVENVGGALPVETVKKWLCLLFEYLELNEDEQVLVVCLLRKFVQSGGKFVGAGDWARPQRWECVVAISCYFAVLLTEEFPGRTSLDLRELLGPNFRFGTEQVTFLKAVDWRISVDDISFADAKKRCVKVANNVPGELDTLMSWFRPAPTPISTLLEQATSLPSPVPSMTDILLKTPPSFNAAPPQMKKRPYSAIAPIEDSMVPLSFVPTVVPTIPQQWAPHGW